MFNNKKKAMQEAIDAAWNNPEGAELRAQLFPAGKPTPEEFIKKIADYVRKNGQKNYS